LAKFSMHLLIFFLFGEWFAWFDLCFNIFNSILLNLLCWSSRVWLLREEAIDLSYDRYI
jgi:hypothetical protein